MWRRTSETKPPLSATETSAPPTPISFERPAPAPAAELRSMKTLLGSALALRGELAAREDVCIEGEFEGQIRVSGAGVLIGASGRVNAKVEADEIVVEGRIEGDLLARERVVIRRTGRVTGNIETLRLLIEDGAIFCGRVEMARPGEARVNRPAARPRIDSAEFEKMPVEANESVS